MPALRPDNTSTNIQFLKKMSSTVTAFWSWAIETTNISQVEDIFFFATPTIPRKTKKMSYRFAMNDANDAIFFPSLESAFLVAEPDQNVMAIFLASRVLGFELGTAQMVAVIGMSIVIGLLMALIFRKS